MKLSDARPDYGRPQKPGIALDFTDPGSVIDLPTEDLAKAARNVASRAADADDARLLLDVLGLLPKPTNPEAAQ